MVTQMKTSDKPVWRYINELLGPGLNWDHSKEQFAAAIAQAQKDSRQDAVEHLQTLLERRNAVWCERDKKPDPAH